jgi:hypothetical protein
MSRIVYRNVLFRNKPLVRSCGHRRSIHKLRTAPWERPVVRFFGGRPRRCGDGFSLLTWLRPDCTAGYIDEPVGPRSRVRRLVDVELQRSSTSMVPDANDPPWPEWRRVPRASRSGGHAETLPPAVHGTQR